MFQSYVRSANLGDHRLQHVRRKDLYTIVLTMYGRLISASILTQMATLFPLPVSSASSVASVLSGPSPMTVVDGESVTV